MDKNNPKGHRYVDSHVQRHLYFLFCPMDELTNRILRQKTKLWQYRLSMQTSQISSKPININIYIKTFNKIEGDHGYLKIVLSIMRYSYIRGKSLSNSYCSYCIFFYYLRYLPSLTSAVSNSNSTSVLPYSLHETIWPL